MASSTNHSHLLGVFQRVTAESAYKISTETHETGRGIIVKIASRNPLSTPYVLRLGNHQHRTEFIPTAAREYLLTTTDKTNSVRNQWEVNWGVSNQALQSSVPDFPWFHFRGVPATLLGDLLLFLHGMYVCSINMDWKQRLVAYRVQQDDGTLSGLVQLSLESKARDARNYHFVLPWIEYFEENLPLTGRGLVLRQFRGKCITKTEFEDLMPSYGELTEAVGDGEFDTSENRIPGKRGRSTRVALEERAEMEWNLKKQRLAPQMSAAAGASTGGVLDVVMDTSVGDNTKTPTLQRAPNRDETTSAVLATRITPPLSRHAFEDVVDAAGAAHMNRSIAHYRDGLRQEQEKERQQRTSLYVHSSKLLSSYDYKDDATEYILPELAQHFYTKRQLPPDAKQELKLWKETKKVKQLFDSAGNLKLPKTGHLSHLRTYGAVLAHAFMRMSGGPAATQIRFATFELNYDNRDLDDNQEPKFEETCFGRFRDKFPNAKENLKHPSEKRDLYEMLHNLVLVFLEKYADKRRPHAYIIGMEPSYRKWKGEPIPHAHVLFFFPNRPYDQESMRDFCHSIGLRFKNRYWVPAASRSFGFIEIEFFEILLIILNLLKCQMAHTEKLTSKDWSIDLYQAGIQHTQFFPVWIQIGQWHVIRDFHPDPVVCGPPYRRFYRSIRTPFLLSQSQSSNEGDGDGDAEPSLPTIGQVEVIGCDEDDDDEDGEPVDTEDESFLATDEMESVVGWLEMAKVVVDDDSDEDYNDNEDDDNNTDTD